MLVPDLRPLSVGEIIDVAIKIWRRHLPTLAKIVFVVVAPFQILAALVAASVSSSDAGFETFDAQGNSTLDTGALAGFVAGMFTAQALSALAFLIASAAVLRAVSVAYLGGTPDWQDSLRAATSRLGSLIWLALLMFGGLMMSAVALFLPFVWLGVAWSLAFPVLVGEGARGTGALRRSFRLVRGRWWPTFGALLLAFMFQFFLGLVLGIPLGLLTAGWDSASAASLALTTAVSVVSSVVTTPFMAAVLVLIYFDLRVRKEGFDLELLSQGVGIPGADLPARGPWSPGGDWPAGGGWPATPRRKLATPRRKLARPGRQPGHPRAAAGPPPRRTASASARQRRAPARIAPGDHAARRAVVSRRALLGAVDPGAARKAAEDILADDRYHPSRAPRPFAGFFHRLGELIVDPIIRFFRGIGDLFPDVGSAPWLVLAAVVVVAAAVLTARLSAGRGRQRFDDGRRAARDEDGLDPDELERRAEEAERRGDLDAALRLRFRAGLARLADAGVVRLRPGLTNATVSRTLRSPRFDELAGDFDEVAYGGRPATETDVAAARSTWPTVLDFARQPSEARR